MATLPAESSRAGRAPRTSSDGMCVRSTNPTRLGPDVVGTVSRTSSGWLSRRTSQHGPPARRPSGMGDRSAAGRWILIGALLIAIGLTVVVLQPVWRLV